MSHDVYSTYNNRGKWYYQHHNMDLRVEEYTQLRESTPSPLRNILQRRWHERASNVKLYNTEDHSTYQHDRQVPHNVPVYSRQPEPFHLGCGSDKNRLQQVSHDIGLSRTTDGYNGPPPRYNKQPQNLCHAPTTARVKRRIPPEWILQPCKGQPVIKQRKTRERHGHHDNTSSRPQPTGATAGPILPGTTAELTPPAEAET